jgi:fructosamine-3-kinase
MADAHVKTYVDRNEAIAEAVGLRWLAEAESSGGVRIARVLEDVDERNALRLERIDDGHPSALDAERFGRALAETHAAGADGWGTPPPAWPDGLELRMGRSRTPFVRPEDAPPTWGEFFAEYRVRDFVRRIVDSGEMTATDARVFDRVSDRLAAGELGSAQPGLVGDRPARLHGDLGAGNVLWPGDEPTGAVLIDPTAHGGHAETDLALLALFGLPRLEAVVAAYDEASPLADGWQDRVELHQLAPLLLHSLLFGGSYTGAALRAARRYA